MEESDVETIIQQAVESYPDVFSTDHQRHWLSIYCAKVQGVYSNI
jgi:hypothetical protein